MTEGSTLTPDEVQAMVNDLAGRCRECRWWGGFGPGEESQRFCVLSHSNHEHKYPWSLARSTGDLDPAYLITQPGFGCVQFKAKEAE